MKLSKFLISLAFLLAIPSVLALQVTNLKVLTSFEPSDSNLFEPYNSCSNITFVSDEVMDGSYALSIEKNCTDTDAFGVWIDVSSLSSIYSKKWGVWIYIDPSLLRPYYEKISKAYIYFQDENGVTAYRDITEWIHKGWFFYTFMTNKYGADVINSGFDQSTIRKVGIVLKTSDASVTIPLGLIKVDYLVYYDTALHIDLEGGSATYHDLYLALLNTYKAPFILWYKNKGYIHRASIELENGDFSISDRRIFLDRKSHFAYRSADIALVGSEPLEVDISYSSFSQISKGYPWGMLVINWGSNAYLHIYDVTLYMDDETRIYPNAGDVIERVYGKNFGIFPTGESLDNPITVTGLRVDASRYAIWLGQATTYKDIVIDVIAYSTPFRFEGSNTVKKAYNVKIVPWKAFDYIIDFTPGNFADYRWQTAEFYNIESPVLGARAVCTGGGKFNFTLLIYQQIGFEIYDVDDNLLEYGIMKIIDKEGNVYEFEIWNGTVNVTDFLLGYMKATEIPCDGTWYSYTTDQLDDLRPFTIEIYVPNRNETFVLKNWYPERFSKPYNVTLWLKYLTKLEYVVEKQKFYIYSKPIDYKFGEPITLFVQVVDDYNNPVDYAIVKYKLEREDGTLILDWTPMQNVGSGIYKAVYDELLNPGIYFIYYNITFANRSYLKVEAFRIDYADLLQNMKNVSILITNQTNLLLFLLGWVAIFLFYLAYFDTGRRWLFLKLIAHLGAVLQATYYTIAVTSNIAMATNFDKALIGLQWMIAALLILLTEYYDANT